jgi:transcriptional regulator with XRE-family HTH domain
VTSSEDQLLGLAHRLRALREEGLAGQSITQRQLAEAFDISVPSISSWESTSSPKVPLESRLQSYATFFATERSVAEEPFHLVDIATLTHEEERRRDELFRELVELRSEVVGHSDGSVSMADSLGDSLWHFPSREDVTIVCAELPKEMRPKTISDPTKPDFDRMYGMSDLEALLEVYGHIRAFNPISNVKVRTPSERLRGDYSTHLVVLGGVDFNSLTRDLQKRIPLPVRQKSRKTSYDAGVFEVVDGSTTVPFEPNVLVDGEQQDLLEDVAYFYRGPNPFNKKRTITICNGMFGRGTFGVVRALTDPKFRDRNEDYVRRRLTTSDSFGILTRVLIVQGEVVTPDWTLDHIRLHEWPKESREPHDDHRKPVGSRGDPAPRRVPSEPSDQA